MQQHFQGNDVMVLLMINGETFRMLHNKTVQSSALNQSINQHPAASRSLPTNYFSPFPLFSITPLSTVSVPHFFGGDALRRSENEERIENLKIEKLQ